FLAHELARAEKVSPAEIGPGVATMHSGLEYRDDMTGRTERTVLVYPGQEHEIPFSVSVLSPAGTALLGLTEGQSIQWRTDEGRWRRLVLQLVTSQPEQIASWAELGRFAERAVL